MPPKSGFAPKVRVLSPNETQSSFEIWKETLLFNLTIDGTFEFLLADDVKWKSIHTQNRGLAAGPGSDGQSAKQRAAILQMLLGTIASYAPVISRQYVTKEALSLDDIWHRLRIFYGFRKSGALILDLPQFHLEEGESHEALWERFHAFAMDNLLQPSDGLKHLSEDKPDREEMSPTLLNTMVVLWLRTIHQSLPALVKQKYSTELRTKTIATLREDISESIDSMLAELSGESAASISRSSFFNNPRGRQNGANSRQSYRPTPKFCPLCDACNRSSDHFLSECMHLPEADKKYMSTRARSRPIGVEEVDEFEEMKKDIQALKMSRVSGASGELSKEVSTGEASKVGIRKVDVKSSPYLMVQYGKHSVKLTIDSGAEGDVMKEECALKIGAKILPSSAGATLGNGETSLNIVGEVHLVFRIGNITMEFHGLVARDLADDVLAGVPFMDLNDVYARPSKRLVYVGDIPFKCGMTNKSTRAEIMRVPRSTAVLAGESLKLPVPASLADEAEVAITPIQDAPSLSYAKYNEQWLHPQIVPVEDGHITLRNSSYDPVLISRHEQIARLRPVTQLPETCSTDAEATSPDLKPVQNSTLKDVPSYKDISIDPDNILSESQRKQFSVLHEEYQEVFDGSSLGCYNGASGPLEVKINMGPTLPPQRKGKMPLYSRGLLQELQQACDQLEGTVLLKPEDVGVVAEYLSPSFLVTSKGKKRLVTAFGEVGQYAKPQQALMPDINEALRRIAEYRYIIESDLTKAYYQLLVDKDSMKYTGIATPFKGVRVYGRGAMGMPGTETALEEVLCRVLGRLIEEGGVTRVADDIYCGGSSPEEALSQWRQVLQAMKLNGLRLSPSKTVVCPKSTCILGWIWEAGTIRASPHKISALITVKPPKTVTGMRSFIGGFKYLSKTLKSYSEKLEPLEEAVAGKGPAENVEWSDALHGSFKQAQDHLETAEAITIPRKDDKLLIITDASSTGMGAGLYVLRGGKQEIAGYFSARYKKHQRTWMPCEWEALSISTAIMYFAPYLVNSPHQTLVLTDSLPCVQAFNRLRKGQFSSSSRVTTFLAALCRFNVHLSHVKGSENIYADFASRNAAECNNDRCQVCKYVQESSESVVRACTVSDVLSSAAPVPYCSRSGWFELQLSDDYLRRACAHLKQGTKPSRKSTGIKDVKRYLQVAKVSRDGLLVVDQYSPSTGKIEKIVVPRSYLPALLECLHIKLQHPSKNQLKNVFSRAFYALDLDDAAEEVAKGCHTCISLADMPNRFLQQSSTTIPTSVGSNFSADVVQRGGQSILLIREYVSSYTAAKLIWNEKASSIRTAMLILTSELIPHTGFTTTVKVDPASACRSLEGDQELKSNGICLELGRPKFKNKNPVAERAIRELHSEINRAVGESPNITEKILAKAVQSLNCRLRSYGVSSREIWTKRNQFNGEQLPIDDLMVMKLKEKSKESGHTPSATFKARGKVQFGVAAIKRGDLVYINSDRSKTKARDRYVVIDVEESTCRVQKFTGTQLRARVYTVHRADVTIVKPWQFESGVVYEEEEEEDVVYPAACDEVDEGQQVQEEAQLEGEGEISDEKEGEEEEENTGYGATTRLGRKTRLPSALEDYVVRKE